MQLLNSASKKSLTHSYVLAELIALALIRRFPRSAVLAFVMDLLDNPGIEAVWVDEQLCRVNYIVRSRQLQILSPS